MENSNNNSQMGKGGDGGHVFIVAKNIRGEGAFTADGGDGSEGGKGGKVTLISEDNQFKGKISARGGKSLMSKKEWYQTLSGQIFIGLVVTLVGGWILWLMTK